MSSYHSFKGTTSDTYRIGKNGLSLTKQSIISPSDFTVSVGTGVVVIDSSGYIKLPTGTTEQRLVGEQGAIRFNSTESSIEVYQNSHWESVISALPSIVDGSFLREDSSGRPYWSNVIDGGEY